MADRPRALPSSTAPESRKELIIGMARRMTQMELAARLAAIVDSSEDAIISKDLNGTIQSWNKAAEVLFGYTAEEAIGRSIRMLIPADRQDEEDVVLEAVSRGERIEHYETVRQRKDGTFIDISLTVSPVRDESGQVIGASKIARDISVRKRADESLARSMQMKDDFLSLVSHELRTPISMVVGNGNLLLRRRDRLTESETQQALEDLVAQSKRLQGIIENLLLLTRMDREERLDLEPVHLLHLASGAIDAFVLREPHRTVTLHAEAEYPLAMGDAGLLSLVVDNLLTNASKYSPATQPIDVCLSRGEDGWIEMHILDRGIGLEEDDTEAVFAPFYRAPAARLQASGMGLGLAVCRRAMEAQGGTICAHPREGGGSDFVLRLPPAGSEL